MSELAFSVLSRMKQDPRIIRHLIMKQKQAITKPCPPPPEYRPPEIGSLLQRDDDGNIIALQDEDEWEEYEEYEEGDDEYEEGEEEFLLEDESDEDDVDFQAEDGMATDDRAKAVKEVLREVLRPSQ
jgi:hypothetical protein